MIENESLKQKILELVLNSDRKLSQSSIENILSSELNIKRKEIRKALNGLISEGELEYTYIFGTSYVEKSFNRPVRISSSVIVKPYNLTYNQLDSDIVIDIFPGISFGSGEHPTTRLSIQGIEYALKDQKLIHDFQNSTVLDIGTGSGILAIATLKFGIETGIGVDTDPCSISEAKKNARINGLENRIRILNPSEQPNATFSFITANLRFPDIMNLFPVISKNSKPGAPVVLSGIRPEEIDAVIDRYTKNNFKCLLTSEEKNWSCLVLQKNN
ncbi:MAG: methyltransferase [Desulfobacteraceae bacterium]|nr:50S ribosomal protein L11 methyltransferase [Desulfobacteraceae bacterium]MBC2758026.1 methyltransferase [Desulfobacteraceae bacterium]